MVRKLIYDLFSEYFNGQSLVDVWEIGTELVIEERDKIGYKILTETDPLQLLNSARTDPKAFELFQQGMIHALQNNLEIPIPAQKFLAEYLGNPKLRPKQKTGTKTDDDFNWRLRLALLELEDEGIKPTKGEKSDLEGCECGIDIVLEVLCQFEQSKEYTYENLARRYFRTLKKFPKPPK